MPRLAGMLLVLAGAILLCHPGHAGQERYDYEAPGRLIRVIDENSRVSEYQYDAAGNLLRVITGSDFAQAPVVSSVSPSTVRRSETRPVTISITVTPAALGASAEPGIRGDDGIVHNIKACDRGPESSRIAA